MPLLVLSLTRSALAAGLAGTVSLVSQAVGQIPGGAIVDRYSRRALLVVSAITGFSIYSLMFALYWLDALPIPAILSIAALSGLRGGLFGSITDACLKSVVPARHLSSAFAMNTGRDSTIGLVAGPIGGGLYSIGPIVPFAVDALSYLGVLYSAKRIEADLGPSTRDEQNAGGSHLLRDILEGWAWIWKNPTIRQLILVSALVMAGVNGVLLANILSWTRGGVPAVMVGLLETMVGLGALVGSFFAARASRSVRGSKLIMIGTFALGTLLTLTAFARSLPFVFLCYVLAFWLLPIINAAAGGYLMAVVPSDYQGRVWSAAGMISMGLGAVGPVVVGLLVDVEESGLAIAIFGCLVVIAGGMSVFSSGIRSIPRSDEWSIG